MSGSSAGYKQFGAACENCSEPFSLSLAVKDFKSVEQLPDPFLAKCPVCGHEAEYAKSVMGIFASVGFG